jgi:hypothetical protein
VDRIGPEEVARALTPEEKARRNEFATAAGRLRAEVADLALPPLVYAVKPTPPEPTVLLRRGDVEKPKGGPLSAAGLSVVRSPSPDFGLPADAPEAERRRRLADWVAATDNPLTWRVMANRIWQGHLGRGIVGTPNDFGLQGERPTHPELLDWLAMELAENGGRLKHLHRLIVTSATYRQSARFDGPAAGKDAEGRLLWRFPPRRLEGEAVRDAMLAASGRLNPKVGGPSVRAFTVTRFNSDFYTLTDPDGPEADRRSLYRMQVISARLPLLDALDCPEPSVKTPRRAVTTTPLQALALMNNAFVRRQAGYLADRARREGGSEVAGQVDRAYRLALGRPPAAEESAVLTTLARDHGLKEACWVLLNCNEFLYVR